MAATSADRLPATIREILSKSLTVRGFINYEFAEQHYAEFLRGRCRHRRWPHSLSRGHL